MGNYWLDLEEQSRVEKQQEIKKLSGMVGTNKWYSGAGGPLSHVTLETMLDVKGYGSKILNSPLNCISRGYIDYTQEDEPYQYVEIKTAAKTLDLVYAAVNKAIAAGADEGWVESDYRAPWER